MFMFFFLLYGNLEFYFVRPGRGCISIRYTFLQRTCTSFRGGGANQGGEFFSRGCLLRIFLLFICTRSKQEKPKYDTTDGSECPLKCGLATASRSSPRWGRSPRDGGTRRWPLA